MIKLLVVEDDKVLSNNIKEILAAIGEITQVYDGSEGLFELESGVYDLAILDLMMPEMNGYEVLAKIRKEKIQTPVLILTAKDSLEDKIEGFERGADDYLTKPFYREELIMRVKALLKRSLGLLKYKDISCDLKSNEVLYKEQVLPIQGKEFELLVYFLQNKGIILTKEQIFDRIWGFDSDTTITVIEVYMSNLRKHLRSTGLDKEIKTLRNVGYILQRV
ncbi:TPA: response regulator transcription factor [Enterococcus faecium]|uniref:response regulator transcription factor n=1 Tax=Enterococcus faecium TaxID=1352 RepID=UPI0018C1F7F0|nr:response regulator transcription factor [Enterococcus faecium]MBG0374673.1 response regulator transcription factor [Enterococcus faecium]MBG0385227.1 response regulator transcription factor [Enterococcus faecium]MBG0391150.1 response regulator transcription factor [Enterococcus faecium]MBG0421005.1 response regulator transcription factor [Enterococcus faecium]MBG8037082.1 response regulator transcription factor [Enterococcus faecium]